MNIPQRRFVSFLLRLAHDKSLRQTGADVPEESVEVLLMKQVDQLANQIIKTKEEPAATPSGAASTGPRFMRAVQMHMGDVPVLPASGGVNF